MSGRILTLIGADGAGKSTLARRLRAATGPAAVRIYMGSNPAALTHALPPTRAWLLLKRLIGRRVHDGGPPVTRLERPPRGRITRLLCHTKSLAVLAFRVSEEVYRLLFAEWLARRGHLVILDRHPYADYYMRRVRKTGRWLRLGDRIHGVLLERAYPRPKNVVLLDAPADVLYSRKPEGSPAAVRSRRQEYLQLAADLEDVTVLDATRSEADLLNDLLAMTERFGGAPQRNRATPAFEVDARPSCPEREPR